MNEPINAVVAAYNAEVFHARRMWEALAVLTTTDDPVAYDMWHERACQFVADYAAHRQGPQS